jgi:putative spermidine/putrescine transport system substrate-binding protein
MKRKNEGMRKLRWLLFVSMTLFIVTGCSFSKDKPQVTLHPQFVTWDEVIQAGKDQEVTILMWGGNENINRYMDGFVAPQVKKIYGITLKRVPMNAPEFVAKIGNEKKNNLQVGTADLVWINGENFRKTKNAGLLWGPYTHLLPNLKQYYDQGASDMKYDTGVAIDGMEGIFGRAQLVFTYDEALLLAPPTSFQELLVWAKKNPGKLTYPKLPEDFAGVAFVRTAYYELTGKKDIFQTTMTKEEFMEISKPVVAYFKELNPYLWQEGKAYPANQAQLDELFKNKEVYITMGFEIGKTPGMVAKGVYPRTAKTFVFSTGTIGNSHYLAVPFNAPRKAGALLVMDFLQSPVAQLEKFKPEVWGDMPAMDVQKISAENKMELARIEETSGGLSLKTLAEHRLPEMRAEQIDWIKEIWVQEIGGK